MGVSSRLSKEKQGALAAEPKTIKAISSANASTALLEVASGLDDPESEVRLSAVKAVEHLAGYPKGLRR